MQENGKIINRYKVNNDRKSIKRALSPYVHEDAKAVLESGWNWYYFTIWPVIVI